MSGIGLWRVTDNGPSRLSIGEVQLERNLEDWIAKDPSLLEQGLTVVGRQIQTEAGPLDLLALDPQGRWVLIEIKRGRLRRDVVSQAIDYASALAAVDPDELRRQCDAYLTAHGRKSLDGRLEKTDEEMELVIYLVGAGVDPGLERMVSFLSDRTELAIRVVTFSVFSDQRGGTLLAREIHEQVERSASPRPEPASPRPTIDELLSRADRNGVGSIARPIIDAAKAIGLPLRPYGRSIAIAAPQNKTRTLIYLPVDRDQFLSNGRLKVWVGPDAFAEFFDVDAGDVERAIGFDQFDGEMYPSLDENLAKTLAQGLTQMFGNAAKATE